MERKEHQWNVFNHNEAKMIKQVKQQVRVYLRPEVLERATKLAQNVGRNLSEVVEDALMRNSPLQNEIAMKMRSHKSTKQEVIDTINQAKNEVWICYPKTGATNGLPNEALIWNYLDNTWSLRELPGVNYIAKGLVNPAAQNFIISA